MILAPNAFLIHGYLGSGKTTFSKQIEQERQVLRFSHDEWMSRLYGENPPADNFQQYASRVSGVMEDIWTRCLEHGTSVVLDFGFWSRSERDRVRALVSALGGEPVIYRLNCSASVAWERIVERNRRLAGSLYISPNTYEVLKARFEPLDPDEHCIEVETNEEPRFGL